MTTKTILTKLQTHLPQIKFTQNVQLAAYTAVKIGGPAEIFCQVTDRTQLIDLLKFVKTQNIPFYVLGFGSNTLIADRGFKGLVILNRVQGFKILDRLPPQPLPVMNNARWQNANDQTLAELYQPTDFKQLGRIRVEVEAGTLLGLLVNKLISQNVSGLEWFTKIPGSLGGAIVNNIHGGEFFLGQFVESVTVVDKAGQLKTLSQHQLEFEYDYSRFHHSEETIIFANLLLFEGRIDKAKLVLSEWSQSKADQPQNSLGCVFKNLSLAEQHRLKLPNPSAGYVIDQILNLKGLQIGDAKISNKHAAFIENLGQATASDYLKLIKKITNQSQVQLNLILKPEIFFLGFTPEELTGIIES